MEITGVTFEGGVTVTAPQIAGTLFSWGYNSPLYGQLGLGDKTDRSEPTQVGGGAGSWQQVASGRNTGSTFSGAIGADGTLWTWGSNSSGSLGQGSFSSAIECSSPVQVGALSTWSKLNLGQDCGFAIKTNGTLWAWGLGATGQLGLNNQLDYKSPKQVGNLTNWKQVSAANGRSVFAVKTDGTLWAWGQNFDGRLGIGNTISRSSPTQIGTDNDWSQVVAGPENGFAIKTNGTLWAWGSNTQGQLGVNNTVSTSSPVQVGADSNWAWVATRSHSTASTAAIRTDGTLWTWGPVKIMQGRGASILNASSPVQVGTDTNWAQVSCGYRFVLASKTDGTLWAWGDNSYGQLGNNNLSISATYSPIQVGTSTWWASASGYIATGRQSSFGVTTIIGAENPPIQLNTVTGTPPTVYQTWTWGDNTYGQLGTNNTTAQSSPVQVASVSPWGVPISKFGAGININHFIKVDGTLWGVGSNNGGQLGVGNQINYSSPVQVGTDTTWVDISDYYMMAGGIKSTGTLWTWGTNGAGCLGLNNTNDYSSPVQVGTDTNWQNVRFGFRCGAAVKTDGTLWSWGYNAYGQLGQNDTVNRSSPTQVGTDTNWSIASIIDTFVIALKTDGTLWSWGKNTQGCLGQGFSYGYNCSSPVQIGADTNWATISPSGGNFVIATKTDGTLWSWGNNSRGQLGQNTSGVEISSPVQIGTHTNWINSGAGLNCGIAMKNDGTVWIWGDNTVGSLGLNLAPSVSVSSPTQIGAGSWLSMYPTWQGAELVKAQ